MARRHSLRFLLVLALSLVMTAGMIVPATADSENDSVVVTGQVLPYLEVSITPTAINFGQVPSVWNPADYPGWTGSWFFSRPFSLTVTSNLPYGTQVAGTDSSTGITHQTHFVVWLQEPSSAWGGINPTSRDAMMSGGPVLNRVHASNIGLELVNNAMPIPPGTINFAVIFTVSQVI
jgi:hypothetical protein